MDEWHDVLIGTAGLVTKRRVAFNVSRFVNKAMHCVHTKPAYTKPANTKQVCGCFNKEEWRHKWSWRPHAASTSVCICICKCTNCRGGVCVHTGRRYACQGW